MARYHRPSGAENYAHKYERSWSRRVTNEREHELVRRFLARFRPDASLMNAPCGAGRFASILGLESRRHACFADISAEMVSTARAALGGVGDEMEWCVLDLVNQMPARPVDLFLCLRLLHHLRDPAMTRAVVDHVARTAEKGILITFASRSTWKGWTRALRTRLGWRKHGESPISNATMRALLAERGWRVVDESYVSRLFSSQCYLTAVPAG